MKLKLGQYAKKMKMSRYEVLRLIMHGKIPYEEVIENGKKVYYILSDEPIEAVEKRSDVERFECGGVMIEIENDRLVLKRDGKVEIYKKVSDE